MAKLLRASPALYSWHGAFKMFTCRHSILLLFLAGLGFAHAVVAESPSEPALREELLSLRIEDQTLRTRETVSADDLVAVDEKNTARLKQIIAKYGWPTKTMVGQDGADAAWLLAQHADHDPAFQLLVLGLMEKLIPQGEASLNNYAYLFDRTHRPQRYGTQGACVGPGKWTPREIDDAEAVDGRRASMKMHPAKLNEYIDLISKLCK
jgi:hypothetical protein